MTPRSDRAPRLLLVCSPGGHLLQMLCLKAAWVDLDRLWVADRAADVDQLLTDETVVLARGPTNRSVKALLANLKLAWQVIRRERPDAILSTGSGLAVPFFVVGRLFGVRLIFVESLTRINGLSLTGRMVYPLSDAFFVQWPETTDRKRAQFVGGLM